MKKIISLILIAIVALSFCGLSGSQVAFAEAPSVIDFDYTYVLDDLASSTVLGEEFNITDYPLDADGSLQLMSFTEYAYSSDPARRGHFGLYIYLYNPAGMDYSAAAFGNKIKIATKYNDNGSAIDYEKFDLKILSKSEAPYKNRFIKLKVVDHKTDGIYIADRVNAQARRYDISEIELIASSATSADAYSIARTYVFTGFATGYADTASEQSTLACTIQELETIELKVNHTYFRTGLSSLGKDHQNQLDSVYFGVDADVLEEYGRLQRIKAEWYEYRTNPIVVTQHEGAYGDIIEQLGSPATHDYGVYYGRKLVRSLGSDYFTSDWAYNPASLGGYPYIGPGENTLYHVFYTPNIEAFDPRSEDVLVGDVKSNLLYQHIMQYNNSFEHGTLPIKNGTISADLFEDTVDEARIHLFNDLEATSKNGYYVHDFDVDVDLMHMPSYSVNNPGFIDKVKDFGFLNTIFGNLPELGDSYKDIPPIYQVSDSDLLGSDTEIAARLFICKEDVGKFKSYFADEKAASREVFLFRFATTDYFSAPATIVCGNDVVVNEAYIAQETVFLDFDIIQLTFNKNGVYRVIPVVHSPIDAVASLTPPAYIPDDSPLVTIVSGAFDSLSDLLGVDIAKWVRIVITVIVAVVAILLATIVIWLIVKFIKWLIEAIKNIRA